MAILITRTAVVPVWLLAGMLVVVFAAPSGMVATALLLLTTGLAIAAIVLLGNAAHPPVSDGLPTIDVKPLSVTPVEAPLGQRAAPWPNSGFRNIGRGTKGG